MTLGLAIFLAALCASLGAVLVGSYLMRLYFDYKLKFFTNVVSITAKMVDTYNKQKEAEKNGDKKDI